MKKFIAALALTALAPFASAASLEVIQPGLDSGMFSWDEGLGDTVDFRRGTSGPFAFDDLQVLGPTTLVFSARDGFVIGDAFAPIIDGVQTTWDIEGVDSSGYFAGVTIDLIGAGPTLLDLVVTEDCCGAGAGYWKVVTTDVGEVPLPAAAWFFLSAVGGLGLVKRRQR